MMQEIPPGARRDDDRKFPGRAIKGVVAAIGRVVPRNLRIADAGWIRIGRPVAVVDPDLPGRTTCKVAAGDRGLAARRVCGHGSSRSCDHTKSKGDGYCTHGCLSLLLPISCSAAYNLIRKIGFQQSHARKTQIRQPCSAGTVLAFSDVTPCGWFMEQ